MVSLQVLAAGKADDDAGCSQSNTESFNDEKRNTELQDQVF